MQAAVTFPEVIATSLEQADTLGRQEFEFQLQAEHDYAVLIDGEPSAKDWQDEGHRKLALGGAQ